MWTGFFVLFIRVVLLYYSVEKKKKKFGLVQLDLDPPVGQSLVQYDVVSIENKTTTDKLPLSFTNGLEKKE